MSNITDMLASRKEKKKKRENKSNKDQQFSFPKKKSPKGRINTHFNAL